jgi:tetraacyldisaccharide 4'-kinase
MKDFLYPIAAGHRRDAVAMMVGVPLWIGSLIYGAAVRVMLAGYASGLIRRKHLSVPVISVGNLTLGGVGKTPMVVYLARMLKARGFKPAILTRGYMPSENKQYESDEAQILQHMLDVPVVVNPDRHKGGLEAIHRHNPNVIILDDGFQHWRLFRNLEIVLVDAGNPFGPGGLLPAGILREPVSSLKRADIIVLTKTDQADAEALKARLKAINPNAPVIETIHRPMGLQNIFTGNLVHLAKLEQPVVAFCGIGHPASFEGTLKSLRTGCKQFVAFADHHPYSPEDMKRLKEACEAHRTHVLVTTQKDAVKLAGFKDFWQGYEIYSVNVEIEVAQGQHEFADRIGHLLNG